MVIIISEYFEINSFYQKNYAGEYFMQIGNKTKLFFQTAAYNVAAVLLLPVQGLIVIFFGWCYLWRCFRRQVQYLQYPPPPGGMYGNMAKEYKKRVKQYHKQQ